LDEVKSGELIGGRYRLVERLGGGGMGEVWLAVHEGASGFRRTVVCKFVPRDLRGDDRLALMLADEARILGLLHHPNIVAPVDFLDDDDGPVLVLEYVDGCSLRTALRLARRNREPLPEVLASHIGQEVARALEAAHGALDEHGQPLGIVHRDVSPDNVLLTWRGRVRLADFGVARSLANSDVTEPGCAPKGKRGYMSPEQAAGRPVGAQSDIFSLGRVVAEAADLLCGPALRAVLDVATAEKPEDRFHSAEAFAQALFKAAQPPSDPIGALGVWLARAAPEAVRPPRASPAPAADASSSAPPDPRKPFVLDVSGGLPDEIFDADGPPLPAARLRQDLVRAMPRRRRRMFPRAVAAAAGIALAATLAVLLASASGRARIGPFPLPTLHRARGELLVRSVPEGAEVYVDGRLRGIAPCALRLAEGRHEVRVGIPGLSRWRAEGVTLREGGVQVLDVDLAE
jgi:eukaryotic-like serine/threonine-protein kinase